MRNKYKNYNKKIIRLILVSFFIVQSLFSISTSHHAASQKIISAEIINHPAQTANKTQTIKKRNSPALVRYGADLSKAETKALIKRFGVAKANLCGLTNQNLKNAHIPFIGVAGSGGGLRATICMLGFLQGLEEADLLDSTLYQAGVSGATWTIASWILQNFSLSNLKMFIRDRLTDQPGMFIYDIKEVFSVLFKKYREGKTLTLCDIWGLLIANTFLERAPNPGLNRFLSEFVPLVETGRYPLPLFTAVRDHSNPYEWFEFNPFECGSIDRKLWIPTFALGKQFDRGASFDLAAEEPLSYVLGICSSAYAANVKEMLREVLVRLELLFHRATPKSRFPNPFSPLINELLDLQISPPKMYNFAKNIENVPYSSKTHLTLIDAGCDFNLPFPPLLRRNIDIYLVCDASNNCTIPTKYHDLRGAEAYARRNGYKFPIIDYSSIGNEVSVFYDEKDHEVPTVIYVPNQHAFATSKPQYSREEFNLLFTGMRNTLLKHQAFIKNHIIRVINARIINERTTKRVNASVKKTI